jgi:hypothetical protein
VPEKAKGKASFGRDERLVKGSDFNELKKTGSKTHTQHFVIVTNARPARLRGYRNRDVTGIPDLSKKSELEVFADALREML